MADKDEADLYGMYKVLEACKKSKGGLLAEYIEEFERRCAEAKREGIGYASLSKAFKILETSGCSEHEKAEIMAAVMEQAMKEAANEDMESSRMTGIQFDEKEDREMGIKEKERGKR